MYGHHLDPYLDPDPDLLQSCELMQAREIVELSMAVLPCNSTNSMKTLGAWLLWKHCHNYATTLSGPNPDQDLVSKYREAVSDSGRSTHF